MSPNYKTTIFVFLTFGLLLMAPGLFDSFEKFPLMCNMAVACFTISGALIAFRITAINSMPPKILYLVLFLIFWSAQILQIKKNNEHHSLENMPIEVGLTAFSIWIASAFTIFSKNIYSRFGILIVFIITLSIAVKLFLKDRDKTEDYLGHDPTVLGSIKMGWIGYGYFFALCIYTFITGRNIKENAARS